ncbi:hypothetical protein LEP1GSC062_3564 [Leptospira alexanderi serovar Manhao 3 str. L 60]|uniref:Uncharacterized protein n=1 Tax=Leptospira alexanderi serovar Manhao 3 str. L 60 TaxID=1049759 RepID=V6I2W1_9LEPT|nr:hypothetical protein LEP1GSC062_3564 [Leptospira alexanderi serovar Manhao 3 str. L 60]
MRDEQTFPKDASILTLILAIENKAFFSNSTFRIDHLKVHFKVKI